MINDVTLLAVADIGATLTSIDFNDGADGSSSGDIRPFAAAEARFVELAFPKLNFHLDGFLTGTCSDVVDVDTCTLLGGGGTVGDGG